jgi:hypothetical protein
MGIDWSTKKHDIVLLNEAGAIIARQTIPHQAEGFEKLDEMRRQIGVTTSQCLVGMETAHNILEPIRKLLNRTRYAHKRTAQRPTNSRFSCTIGYECYAFLPTIQESFPRPNAVPDAAALQE